MNNYLLKIRSKVCHAYKVNSSAFLWFEINWVKDTELWNQTQPVLKLHNQVLWIKNLLVCMYGTQTTYRSELKISL